KEPGLPGALLVGRATAAALAFAHEKKLIEVNHLHGHFYSAWLEAETLPEFPILILSVSGGHNDLILHEGHGEFKTLGETLDDAAGEAFDKSARLLGLGYPGGPAIEKKAKEGNPHAVEFPRSFPEGYNFSFSGLKTAVLYHVQDNKDQLSNEKFVADVAASFQEAVTDILVKKLMKAVNEFQPKEVHLVGGVSANRFLRGRIEEALSTVAKAPTFRIPAKMSYCTDNAAMIGAAAYFLT
ncbi:MAG: tRNA (adenosine(37)-N6)-threonylcarbamoyltransferase complex transferase subunit TsaD, partial [Patescibacteria group bacterium]